MAKLSPEAQAAIDKVMTELTHDWEVKANWLRVRMSYLQHEIDELAAKKRQEITRIERVKE
jgi:hypothetical protein